MNFEQLSVLRPDLAFIAHWIGNGTQVLDLGCGDGSMTLTPLKRRRSYK